MMNALALLAALTLTVSSASAVESPLRAVSLLHDAEVVRLENLNRLDQLCGTPPNDPSCLEEHLSVTTKLHPIYPVPNETTASGFFMITYSPGIGAEARYLSLHSANRFLLPFEPDIYDSDWGYGPHFHQTLHDQNGDWYQVAVPNPEHPTGWIKLDNAALVSFGPGDLIRFKGTNEIRMILDVTESEAELRPMQEADMWCDPGEPPALESFTPITLPIDALYDRAGRLRFTHAYTRGC